MEGRVCRCNDLKIGPPIPVCAEEGTPGDVVFSLPVMPPNPCWKKTVRGIKVESIEK